MNGSSLMDNVFDVLGRSPGYFNWGEGYMEEQLGDIDYAFFNFDHPYLMSPWLREEIEYEWERV